MSRERKRDSVASHIEVPSGEESYDDGESRQSHEDYSSSPLHDEEEEWGGVSGDEEIVPSDSASTDPREYRPASGFRRVAPRQHKISHQSAPRHAHRAPSNPPMSLDSSDDYGPGYRGSYAAPPNPNYYGARPGGYPQSHAGYAPHPYGQQQVVPYGYGNPFQPQPNGGNYFGADHRGYGEVMHHPGQGYFGQYPVPPGMQQYQWSPPPPPPTELGGPSRTPGPEAHDPEKEAMKKKIQQIEAEAAKKENEARQIEMEKRIREEAERSFQRKLEQMKRDEEVRAEERKLALEKAKKEIEEARKDAERAAREAIEAERRAEAERKKAEAEAVARAERDARDKIEQERRAEEARKKREAEAAVAAEAAAKAKLEAAIKAEADTKAAAEKKAKEDAEWRKNLEEEAKLKAELEARQKIEKERKEAEDAKIAAEAKKKAEEDFKKNALEEAKVKAEEAAGKSDKAPIRFKDAVGRKFSFPFHLCKTWQGMEELIKQAFLHVDGIGPHVQAGHYDLIGPNAEIILPTVWEKVIQPDWAITMQMWPMDRPGPGMGRGHPGLAGLGRMHHPGGVGPGARRPMGPPGAGGGGGGPPPPPAWRDGIPLRPGMEPRGGAVPHVIDVVKPSKKSGKSGAKGSALSWLSGKPAKSSTKKSSRK